MYITGTHFNYYQLCHRKVWLFANNIQMEQTSQLVHEGNLIHQNTYQQRNPKYEEVDIDGIKIDYYDTKNKVIHEIKKSDKKEEAHKWQLKYYIYILKKHGITGVTGILEYPKIRKTTKVALSDADILTIEKQLIDIKNLVESNICPASIPEKMCANCSYYDFCYAGEQNTDN